MSIIFDALKRADAQRMKGQAPSLARALSAPHARSRVRIWALAGLFVVLGLSAWWFRGGPAAPEVLAVVPDAKTGTMEVPTSERNADARSSQPDLSLTEAPGVVPASVVTTDLSKTEVSAKGATRLTLPSLDTPLTGAAQFDRKADPVVNAPVPVSPSIPAPIAPTPGKSDLTPAIVDAKPVQANIPAVQTPVVIADPIAAAPAVTQPAITPEPLALAPAAIPSIFELEYQLRHDLPKMAISMYVYNAQPQSRFVIIGGKRYAEGEQIESKVTISKIRADGIECEFQGTRFFYPRQSL